MKFKIMDCNQGKFAENQKNIEISVILPVFNVGKYLKKCLDSIVNQTFTNIEIICINDGSTDNSLEILNEYAKKDDRFIIISQENQGQGIARNKGINIAQGQYIQFIDPDDWIELDMLEKLYNYAQKHKSQVVKFMYKEYNEYSDNFKEINFIKKIKEEYNYDLNQTPYYCWKNLKKNCLTKLDLHIWTYFYNTNFIKINNIQFAPNRHGEDHLFANGAILLAKQIDFLNEYLYYYRDRTGSSANIQSDNNFCIFDNIQLLKQFIIDHSLYDELKEEIQNYAKQVILWHYDQIPKNSIQKYKELCKEFFDNDKEFKKYLKKIKPKKSFIENIFSIKNQKVSAIKYKAITMLGYTFLIKTKQQRGEV